MLSSLVLAPPAQAPPRVLQVENWAKVHSVDPNRVKPSIKVVVLFTMKASNECNIRYVSTLNPLRWSKPMSFAVCLKELEDRMKSTRNRPIRLQIPPDGSKRHDNIFSTIEEAIDHLQTRQREVALKEADKAYMLRCTACNHSGYRIFMYVSLETRFRLRF